jgi:hypothetical protein
MLTSVHELKFSHWKRTAIKSNIMTPILYHHRELAVQFTQEQSRVKQNRKKVQVMPGQLPFRTNWPQQLPPIPYEPNELFSLLHLPAQTPTFYITSPLLSSTLAGCYPASLLPSSSPSLPYSGLLPLHFSSALQCSAIKSSRNLKVFSWFHILQIHCIH